MVQRTAELQLQNEAKETANLKPDPTMAASYDLFMPPSAGNEGDVWTLTSGGKSVFLPPSTSGGDVVGPSSSVAGNFASFSGTTGKEIEDSGVAIADFATASQGELADSSIQPDDIGSTVQAYDATLQSLSSLGSAADKIAYTTGVDTWAETALTSFGRTFLACDDAAAGRSTLSLTAIAQGITANKGDWVLGSGGGDVATLAVGANGKIPIADSSQATGIKWDDPPAPTFPAQSKIYYVGKHGNDSNSGLNIENAFLTFDAAITAAVAQSPSSSNIYTVVCLDAGFYTEDISTSNYVYVYAPNASITGNTLISQNSGVVYNQITQSGGNTGLTCDASGSNTNYFHVNKINLSGSGTVGVTCTGGVAFGYVGSIVDGGASTAITSSGGTLNISAGHISCATAISQSTGTINLKVGNFSGTNTFSGGSQTIEASAFMQRSRSLSGAAVYESIYNTSNTSSSSAYHQVKVGGGTAADAYYQAAINGGQAWTWGLDNSDSDAFALSSNSTLGSTNVMRVSTAGEINTPLQPAFLASLNSTLNNVSGDSTLVTVIFDNEIFDQNSDYNTTTGVFTAPVTGRYQLNGSVFWLGGTNMNEVEIQLVTSNRTIRHRVTQGTGYTNYTSVVSQLVDMDAGDTAVIKAYTIDSGGKVDDIYGLIGEFWSVFSGSLQC